jgi:hypothetical protein
MRSADAFDSSFSFFTMHWLWLVLDNLASTMSLCVGPLIKTGGMVKSEKEEL